jgi:hypothetical protein
MKPGSWPPDWKDPALYPDHMSPLQWAWEFLRRNAKYQRRWAALIRPTFKLAELDAVWKSEQDNPPGAMYRRRLSSSAPALFEKEFHIATYPPPPPWENEAKLRFNAQFIRYQKGALSGGKPREVHGTVDQDQIVIWFNLGWPIGPQVKNAKKVLEDQSTTKERRLRFSHYQTYLRLLDARAVAASEKQIVQNLYLKRSISYDNARQKLRDDVNPAARLRDEDYWLIAVMGQKTQK